MKRKLLLAFCALLLGWSNASAQWTDVTSTYITNADLKSIAANSTTNGELWPVYTSGRTGNTQHPKDWYLHTNGTTNHNGGGNYFECWATNQGVKRWTLFQNITLPAGKYKLTGQYSTNENRGIIKTVVITPHHTYFSPGITTGNWGSWGSETAEFTLYDESTVRIGMISTNFAQNHGFTLETTGAKQLLADVISEASALSISTTDAQAVYDSGSSTDDDYRSAAKTLHDAVIEYKIAHADSSNPVDMTDYISNPSFEGVGGANPVGGNYAVAASGWTAPSVTDGKIYSATENTYLITNNTEDGFYYINLWNNSATTYSVKQTLANLPAGRYILSAKYASDANNTASLYMGETTSPITAQNKSTFVAGSVTYDLASDGDVEIGMTSSSWMKADGFTLSYVGDPLAAARKAWNDAHDAAIAARDNVLYAYVTGTEKTNLITEINKTEPTTISGYETATEALNNAKSAFTAAKTNYDALVREIAKAKALGIDNATADGYAATSSSTSASVLASTQDLMVAEYDYVTATYPYAVDLGEWTKTNATDRSGQHWDGKAESKYSEQNAGWGDTSWSCSYSQDLLLPAGSYVFKVAGRKSSDSAVLTLTVKKGVETLGTVNDFPNGDLGKGIDTSGATNFGDGTFANGGTGRGWQWRFVKFTLTEEATVNISVNGSATAQYQWVGFCKPTVQADNDDVVGILAYNVAKASAITVRDDAQYVNVTGSERTALVNAINADPSSDYPAATTALDNARAAFTGAKSAYNALATAKATSKLTKITDVGTKAFQYNETTNNELYAAYEDAKDAVDAEVTSSYTAASAQALVDAFNTATNNYNNQAQNAPAENDEYVLTNTAADVSLTVTEGSVTVNNGSVYFTAVDGGYVISNSDNKYISKTGSDNWTLSTTETKGDAYVVTVKFEGDGAYSIHGAKGYFGTDATAAGSAVYANKGVNNNGKWRISLKTASVNVSEAGWATFSSPYALDLEKISGGNAYIVADKEHNDYITLTEQTTAVPANTGLVIKCTGGGTVTIPVAESGTPPTTNYLVASNGGSVTAENYVFAYVTSDYSDPGFYRLTTLTTVPVGKAYLSADAFTSEVKAMYLPFDGTATGVEAPEVTEAEEEEILYNTAGVRVDKNYKGIVINQKGEKRLQK